MGLEAFRSGLRQYLREGEQTQTALAAAIGLHPVVLSNKLRGTQGGHLTQADVKRIILALAAWHLLPQREALLDLLAAVDLGADLFTDEEWGTPPLQGVAGPVPAARPARLPEPATRLVGRTHETRSVADLLQGLDARLVTLTGPGGTGKTRLALAAAQAAAPAFPGGVYWVPLAALTDPALVPAAIARRLELSTTGRSLSDAVAELGSAPLLLVLDNFEQVVAAAPLLGELLAGVPSLTMLVTSRMVLHIYGEYEFAVPPLAVPAAKALPTVATLSEFAAITLFVQRASAVRPGFTLTAANAPAVVAVCARLDGLPLALELAAARCNLFTPAALLARLDRRLDLLTAGARDHDPRHRTLRAAIGWSYDLLTAAEQTAFTHLAVFAGGCTLSAAETVSGAAWETLAALIDHSLLRQESGDDEPYLQMLDTIHEYACERLTADPAAARLRSAHAAYFLAVAQAAEPALMGSEAGAWVARLERDYPNLRAAFHWLLEQGDLDGAMQLCACLWHFWIGRETLPEGRSWLQTTLDRAGAGGDPYWRSCVLNALGNLLRIQGEYRPAMTLFEQALVLRRQLGDPAGIAGTLGNLGATALYCGEYDAAQRLLEENLVLSRQTGGDTLLAALGNLALVATERGDYAAALPLLEECLLRAREADQSWSVANALMYLGMAHQRLGHATAAGAYLHESLALWHLLNYPSGIGAATGALGYLSYDRGEWAAAQAQFAAALRMLQEVHDLHGTLDALQGLARVALAAGHLPTAIRVYAAVTQLREQTQSGRSWAHAEQYTQDVSTARRLVGEAAFSTHWEAGRTLTPLQVLTIVSEAPA